MCDAASLLNVNAVYISNNLIYLSNSLLVSLVEVDPLYVISSARVFYTKASQGGFIQLNLSLTDLDYTDIRFK